jgi:hypothetical protein
MSDAAMRTLLPFLETGEPIPLHWAIEYGDAFGDAWARSKDPDLLIKIAALVGSRRSLVLAASAMARETLPCLEGVRFPPSVEEWAFEARPEEWTPERLLDIAERWAHGDEYARMAFAEQRARQIATMFDVNPHVTIASTRAAFIIADALYLTRPDVFDEASAAANIVRNAIKVGVPRARLVEIIRQYSDPPPTLADVVGVRP